MSETENLNREQLGVLSAAGQLTTLIAPLLYILGQKYASSFFNSLGSGWIVSQISLQETIYYSLHITLPILIAAFFSLEFLIDGTSYKKIRNVIISMSALAFTALIITSFFWTLDLLHLMTKLVIYCFCIIYGTYAAAIFIDFRLRKNTNIKSAIGWIIGSTAFLFFSAGTLGDINAINALEHPEKTFPLIVQNPYKGKPQTLRLVSRIGDSYLLMDQAYGKKVFRIESNLDGYMIQSIDKFRLE